MDYELSSFTISQIPELRIPNHLDQKQLDFDDLLEAMDDAIEVLLN